MAKSARRGSRAVTAEDVARRAGVSPMTVSRVIGGSQNVREATRERVMAAARELNYSPNVAARNLASASSTHVGLLYANPSAAYLSEFMVGMLDEMTRRGVQLTLARCEAGNATKERRAVRQLLSAPVAGLLLPPPLCESSIVRSEAASAKIPVVAVANGGFTGDVSCVRIDDRQAAYDMTCRIVDLGHRQVGFIEGAANQTASAERRAGFEAALRDKGVRAKAAIAQGSFTYQSGLIAAERLLAMSKRPTAIFASNDDMAAAVVSVAHRRGLDVPRDVSVVGFDDSAIATTLWPELTTVRQPIGDMAAAAVDLLVDEINARRSGAGFKPRDIVMPHTLVERQSTAAYQV